MAALLCALIVLGLYMVSLPDAGFDRSKIMLIIYHKELGLAAFGLAAIRWAWRMGNTLPAMVESQPFWQKFAAHFVHLCLYGMMLALPITGLLMSSAAAIPVSLFGLFYLPDLVQPSEPLFRLFVGIHGWLGYGMLLAIGVHAGAALWHHFLLRDDTLEKMLPSRAA
jgi:cytochrome b561